MGAAFADIVAGSVLINPLVAGMNGKPVGGGVLRNDRPGRDEDRYEPEGEYHDRHCTTRVHLALSCFNQRARDQFSEGFSASSITSISMGSFAGSSLSPSCS